MTATQTNAADTLEQSYRIQRPEGAPRSASTQPQPISTDQADVQTEEMLINMGPQHPSTHGVLRIVLRTDGEMVLEAVPHIGYLHRCAEKIGENVAYYQYIPYTDRMDYLAGMNENWAFCMAAERLGEMELPRRAELIRIIIGELNRIASHLVSFGTYGLDIGAFTPFLYAFREREYILDLFEMVCGARLTYSYFTIGGSTHDLTDDQLSKILEFLNYFEPKLREYNDLLSYNQIFIRRTAGIGPISEDLATKYALTGPVIRGSGIPYDLRRSQPYSLYPEMEFDVITASGEMGQLGDCWDRYIVRMREMEQSVKMIRQAIKMLPDPGSGEQGKYRVKSKSFKPKPGEVYVEMENPRGVLGFYLESQGGPIPYRVKARAATFCNLSVTHELCQNVLLADVPAIIGSIDVVMGQVDR